MTSNKHLHGINSMLQHLTKWFQVEVSNIYHMCNGFFTYIKFAQNPI
jgi:hypothetical protein